MEHQRKLFQQRGYSEDLLPKTQSQRTWKTFNYFTLWMGSVHNVPNYVMVGGFFILGLSTFSIMLAIILSAFFIAAVMVLNGAAGSKYGVPFAMILRASYGVRGALFPGLLRGGIAAIMWFGLQCYAGSLACLILIGKIWPGFLTLGGDFTLLGLSLPGLITFLLFWLVNVGIGFGGGKVLNKFTAILNPCIYIVFGGMAIWAISLVGLGPIFDYIPSGIQKAENSGFLFLVVINAVVAVWAAPAVSASDFTQNAHSFREQALGQTLGLVVAYILFAVAGVCIIAGASIHYGADTWNVLDIVQRWDSLFASFFAVLVILTAVITGLVNISNTYGAIRGTDVFYPQQGAGNTRYRRSFVATGFMTLITVPLAVIPFSPFVSSIGLLTQTGDYTRRSFIYGSVICLLVALVPALTRLFCSIPLPVSSAVMLVSYLPLLFSALVFSQQITFTARNIYRLALPLFVGIFLMALPPVYLQDLPLTLRPLLSNGLLVGILLAVLMDNLIPWERIE
ncbi:hypothetical protein A5T62_004351 [Escherichia coli]|nr:solute carrier family 23 protein [Escherichia coli]EFJ5055240.1 hypothetical protein [Escherichia coli]